jgi:hypothetical protein
MCSWARTSAREGGGDPVEGRGKAGTELKLCAIARVRERDASERRQPASERPPDGSP